MSRVATVEFTEDQQKQLAEIASARGERGIAAVVQEAIDQFLARRQERVQAALAQKGVLSEEEADALARHAEQVRASWR